MIAVIDNYDSFTFNLVQLLGELGARVEVFRNDAIDVAGLRALAPRAIVLSPGPGTPDDAGITLDVVRELSSEVPILGVCLGHQSIGQAFGARVVRADERMHGRTSDVQHSGAGLFAGLPSPLTATRYHSLIVDRASLPASLEVTAWTARGDIMGLRHKTLHVEGVQFHPESFLTELGTAMLRTFLSSLGGR